MKAAITTFWDSNDNYGSLLQNYALQRFLNAKGMETCLVRSRLLKSQGCINIIKNVFVQEGFFSLLQKLMCFVPKKLYYRRIQGNDRVRNFDNFRKVYLNMTREYKTLKELKDNPSEADIYITGSDQVWNMYLPRENNANDFAELYFLNFGNDSVCRVSCSACICKNEIREDFKEKLSQLIKRFEFVSTREEFGVGFCRQLGYGNACHQPDPSFLLEASDYRKIYESDKSFLPKQKYVLLYLLNNKCDFSVVALKRWARKNNLGVVYVSGNEHFAMKHPNQKKFYATIPQWLELCENAEYVFTNSFHGIVFSIIYNKKFLAVEQKGRFEYSNARVYTLLDFFAIHNRIYNKNFDAVKNEIDYKAINVKLDEIRTSSPFVKWVKNKVERR